MKKEIKYLKNVWVEFNKIKTSTVLIYIAVAAIISYFYAYLQIQNVLIIDNNIEVENSSLIFNGVTLGIKLLLIFLIGIFIMRFLIMYFNMISNRSSEDLSEVKN